MVHTHTAFIGPDHQLSHVYAARNASKLKSLVRGAPGIAVCEDEKADGSVTADKLPLGSYSCFNLTSHCCWPCLSWATKQSCFHISGGKLIKGDIVAAACEGTREVTEAGHLSRARLRHLALTY